MNYTWALKSAVVSRFFGEESNLLYPPTVTEKSKTYADHGKPEFEPWKLKL